MAAEWPRYAKSLRSFRSRVQELIFFSFFFFIPVFTNTDRIPRKKYFRLDI